MRNFNCVLLLAFILIILSSEYSYSQSYECRALFESDRSGFIEGPNEDESFTVYDFNNCVYMPYEAATGYSSNTRNYQPLVLKIDMGEQTPVFLMNSYLSAHFTNVTIIFTRMDPQTERMEDYFQIMLRNSYLTSVNTEYNKYLSGENAYAELSFESPERYNWEYLPDRITYEDDYSGTIGKKLFKTASYAYATVTVEGIEGGNIDGSSDIFSFKNLLFLPPSERDLRDPRGTKVIEPIRFVKRMDNMTPQLISALCEETLIPEIMLSFYDMNDEKLYEVLVEDASLVKDSTYIYHEYDYYDVHFEEVSIIGHYYTWTDLINDVVYTTSHVQSSIIAKSTEFNGDFKLFNFPNPFNVETVIYFTVPQEYQQENVSLKIFDMNGRLVRELYSGLANSANNFINWDGKDNFSNTVPTGMYFYSLRVGQKSETGKLLLMK
jgi:type VI secretion system Hcp family effector